MYSVRIDLHAHLYEMYSLEDWCSAAVKNLAVSDEVIGVLVVVDRMGQDSFEHVRNNASFGAWQELKRGTGEALAGVLKLGTKQLYIVRGVQYVSAEKLEVLGLGVARSGADGRPCRELINLIRQEGGVACLPWSPGKWLGPRGVLVRELMREFSVADLGFGDISIRSRFIFPSALLAKARAASFAVVAGTDPLPRSADTGLVGSYGVQLAAENKPELDDVLGYVRGIICNRNKGLQTWGGPNPCWKAAARFVSTL